MRFSVPGGYVYITRQLMILMDDESQLAFALGHETGHIAANHAHARQQYAQRGNSLGVLGQIVGAVFGVGGIGSMISQAQSELRTLSFSRDQEYQADTPRAALHHRGRLRSCGRARDPRRADRCERARRRGSRAGPTAKRRNGQARIR